MGQSEIQTYDVDAVNSAENRQLYKKREPIYPKLVHGRFRFIKWVLLFVTLGIYYLLPWLRWDRGPGQPDQAVLVDFSGQRFYFFAIEIWPDELYYVTGLLVLGALVLFFVTALFGRLWCGYTCPQTVWTDLFIAVERFVEGDRNKRLRLAKQKWNAEKITKKLIKHSIWLLIAAMTGGAWVLYFHDAPTVIKNLFLGTAPMTAYLFIAILTFTTYTLAGIMREQVCVYMCPWPRIQAAMTDEETFSIGYYFGRGEPRGKHKKNQSWEGRGDCIDCKACVAACPMGIDIRDGDQLECINCGLCIDACDDIMKKIDRPLGLIAYGSDYREGSKGNSHRLPRLLRSRTIFYGVLIIIVSAIMAYGLSNRNFVELTVERDRAPAYTVLSDGSIRNAITVSILNKNPQETEFAIKVTGPEGLKTAAIGYEVVDNLLTLSIAGEDMQKTRMFLTLPAETYQAGERDIKLELTQIDSGETIVKELTLIGRDR